MPARPKAVNTQRVHPEAPIVATAALPVLASATFYDDVHLEANGKVCIIGCYPGT